MTITLEERARNELHCGFCLKRGSESDIGIYSVEMMRGGRYLPPVTVAQCRDRNACLRELEYRHSTPYLKYQGEE